MESHRPEGVERGDSIGHDFGVEPAPKSPCPREAHNCSLGPCPGYPASISPWPLGHPFQPTFLRGLSKTPTHRLQPRVARALAAARSGFRSVQGLGCGSTHVRTCSCLCPQGLSAHRAQLPDRKTPIHLPSPLSLFSLSLHFFSSLSFLFMLLTLPLSLLGLSPHPDSVGSVPSPSCLSGGPVAPL